MKVHERPLLSIIIPTRNRSQYIGPCVQSLLMSKAQDIEIVVQDNSDDDQTEVALISFTKDKRLIYNHSTAQLSMSGNFSKGLERATGEYIAFLGDDDGVNPELASAVRWAKAEGLDALVGCSAAHYLWPDVTYKLYGKFFSATLLIKPFTGTMIYPDSEVEMQECVQRGGANQGRLPKAYHGVVRREYMEQIFQKADTYFPGPTPDMTTAVALSCVVKRYAFIDYPLFVSGTGRRSGGGQGTEKRHDWSLESVPWFSRRAINQWSTIVPRYCSGNTLWAEDVIQALQAMGRGEMLQHFNAISLYARCTVFDQQHISLTFTKIRRFVRDRKLSRFWAVATFTYYFLQTCLARLRALVSNILIMVGVSSTRRISKVSDINEAVAALELYLHENDHHFSKRIT